MEIKGEGKQFQFGENFQKNWNTDLALRFAMFHTFFLGTDKNSGLMKLPGHWYKLILGTTVMADEAQRSFGSLYQTTQFSPSGRD